MTVEHILAILLFSTIASATPGPNNLMLLFSGINYGFYRTVPHMVGIGIGFTILLIVVGIGIVQVFETYPFVYLSLKILSVCYLLFLSWKIATTVPKNIKKDKHGKGRHKPLSFFQATCFQWVNPQEWTMG
ncbi:MAG: LysE family translocator, partial [Gammaproteobacteria bacterium]|nr:LysE family translocator [Gammaproteobacteria bacterium]